jgi:phosphoserine aminotransferase
LETAENALVDYQGTGIGVMELSHRSPHFEKIITECESNLRSLLNIDDNYAVLFMGGGATMQFSALPMNLLSEGKVGNYILTGIWAEKAWKEGKKFGEVHVAASSKESNYSYIPDSIEASSNPAFMHFTSNNTITGTQYQTEPEAGDIPLACDASSDLLHKKIDVSKYGIIYAGAQKNLGPAGVTLVILRKDLLDRSPESLPIYVNYNTHAKSGSLFNTPPTFPIYVMGEVFKWVQKKGGLDAMYAANKAKAAILYDAIDKSSLFSGIARADCRSLMNVTFSVSDDETQKRFIAEAADNGFRELKGHRSVGGLRASIYNAFPEEGVRELASFMQEFEKKS